MLAAMPKKILIVDDDPDIVYVLSVRLKANGYTTVTAIDGEAALRKAKEEHPDLILLDVVMPKMDGYQVLGELNKYPETKKIPVIMLTARGQIEDADKAMALGATSYVLKPFDSVELLAKVKEALLTTR